MGTGVKRVSTHEVAWVVALLDDMPSVDVLSVRVEPDTLRVGSTQTRAIDVVVEASTWADAILLANALRLREIDGRFTDGMYGRSLWRTWTGWVPEASREQPVHVSIAAAELEHELPTLFDALDAFGKHRRSDEGAA